MHQALLIFPVSRIGTQQLYLNGHLQNLRMKTMPSGWQKKSRRSWDPEEFAVTMLALSCLVQHFFYVRVKYNTFCSKPLVW